MSMSKMMERDLDSVHGGSILPIEVKEGDTLGAIAQKFRMSVEDICRWNDIKDPNQIHAGQILKLKF